LAGLTRSDSEDRPRSLSAVFSVLLGLAAVGAIPAAIVASEVFELVTLLQASVAIAPAFVLGFAAIYLARRTRRETERTLGRVRGYKLALVGRVLGYMALYIAVTASISVATYYVLREVA
jgi:predicted membrane channel-forming protein YqfA (hemolysin III family)